MENIIENYGLFHIAVQICGYLDGESLTNAVQVKSTWRNVITCDPKLDQKLRFNQIEVKSENLIQKFPEWRNIFEGFRKNEYQR